MHVVALLFYYCVTQILIKWIMKEVLDVIVFVKVIITARATYNPEIICILV